MFSDIMLKAMTEEAVVALKGGVAKLDVFATNFSPVEGQLGDGVACPIYNLSVATDFDAESNNFGGGEKPDGVYIPLSK